MPMEQSNSLSSESRSLEGLRVSFVDGEDIWKGKSGMTKSLEFENN